MTEGLLCLRRSNLYHGFVSPDNILMFNTKSKQPNFKLLDVQILSSYKNMYERMISESDYFAPLDPFHMKKFRNGEPISDFNSSCDVWALAIATLCYIFYEDFHIFYDWNARKVRTEKIGQFINLL